MREYQVCWRGFIGGSTGYDRASREYLLGLDRLGVDVKVEPMSYSKELFVGGINPDQVARIKELIAKPYATDKDLILIYHAQPNGVDPVEARNRYKHVIVNTVWETTKVPVSWMENANAADAIFIPSTQNKQALADSGIHVPLYIVPHGADFDTYKASNPPLALANAKDKFTFLSVFQWQHRKSPEILLEAFWREFTSKDNVCLIVKTFWGHVVSRAEQRNIVNQIVGFKESLKVQDTAPLFLTTSIFEDEDLKGLYTLADAFVLPTRGEGVGLPFLESLSSEVPVIATGWGGSMDFLSNDNAYLIDYDLLPVGSKVEQGIAPNFNQLFTGDMLWAEPKLDSVRLQMRRAYEMQELTKTKGKKGRELMESMSWDIAAVEMKKAIEDVIQ